MKVSFLLGILLVTTTSAYAQQSPAPTAAPAPTNNATAVPAKDEWGTEAAPPATVPTTDPAVPAIGGTDATATPDLNAPAAAPSGIDAALGASKPNSGSSAVKPIVGSPKLNPNSAGSYDKNVVKKQNKHTDKVVAKRRRSTARNADIRRGSQIQGIHRMEKGKVSNR